MTQIKRKTAFIDIIYNLLIIKYIYNNIMICYMPFFKAEI